MSIHSKFQPFLSWCPSLLNASGLLYQALIYHFFRYTNECTMTTPYSTSYVGITGNKLNMMLLPFPFQGSVHQGMRNMKTRRKGHKVRTCEWATKVFFCRITNQCLMSDHHIRYSPIHKGENCLYLNVNQGRNGLKP